MDERLAGLSMRRHRATAHGAQTLDDGCLTSPVAAEDERQGLEELDLLLFEGGEATDAADAKFVYRTHFGIGILSRLCGRILSLKLFTN